MKILKVIHGFPPDYMAGSEVYSYHLVKELIEQNIQVCVFTRVENEFDKPYTIYNEIYENIPIMRINKPIRDYRYEDKFYDENIDKAFGDYLEQVKPDIVHFGHLSHLSTSLIKIVKYRNIPLVYTIHDFWLFCIKGQMINQKNERCKQPSIANCTQCSPYVTNESMVEQSSRHMREMIDLVDVFLSPSRTLMIFFMQHGVPLGKIKYMKYGFNKQKITYNKKIFGKNSKIRFGFIGRVIPQKGIKVLVDTFRELPNEQLCIYGDIGKQKRFLQTTNISFAGGYDNNNINEVFANIDVLIVPSLWLENSPLVIQEAQLAGIPVITSHIGGMAELIQDNINGYLFETGNIHSLKAVIEKIVAHPSTLNDLEVNPNEVVSIKENALQIKEIYQQLGGLQ